MGFSGKGGRRGRFGLGPTAAMLAAARRSPEGPQTPSPPPGIGHNQGPPLVATSWNAYCWRKAHKAAWKTPPIEVVRQRSRRAEQLGLTYQEYTAHLLDRGTHLSALLFTLIGTLIERESAGTGSHLADGFSLLPGVAERLSGLKNLKVFVIADLTEQSRDALDPRQAASLVERLNRRCENAITMHEVCSDSGETTIEPGHSLAKLTTDLLRRHGLSPAASVMIGSSDKDRQCSETAGLAKYLWADRFFGWPKSPSS